MTKEEERARATMVVDVDRDIFHKGSREISLQNVVFIELLSAAWDDHWRGGGLVSVDGTITENPAGLGVSYQHSYIEVRVVGSVGSSQHTLARAGLASDAAAFDIVIPPGVAYKRISVLARLVIDGTPGPYPPAPANPPKATASAVLRINST